MLDTTPIKTITSIPKHCMCKLFGIAFSTSVNASCFVPTFQFIYLLFLVDCFSTLISSFFPGIHPAFQVVNI